MDDMNDAGVRGQCETCKQPLAIAELVVAFYGVWTDNEDRVMDGMPSVLYGMTHVGLCAEAFSEGRGDDCTTKEYQPYQRVEKIQPSWAFNSEDSDE